MKQHNLPVTLSMGLLLVALTVACNQAVPSPTPSVIPEEVEAEIAIGEAYVNPLAEVELVLNATLPEGAPTATVLRLSAPGTPSVADVRQIAAQFGLPAELYSEVPPSYAEGPGITEETTPQPPLIYFAFAGPRTFFFSFYNDETRVEYVDGHIPISYDRANFLPFDRAGPVAAAFLEERGLLNFPYLITPGEDGSVQFLRLVDGHPVYNQPEFTAYVDSAGLIFAVSYFPLHSLVPLDGYPSLSAADAWRLIPQATSDQSTYFISSGPANLRPVATPATEVRFLWRRTYQAGQQVSLYGYTTLYQAVEGDGPPRVRLDWFWLEGADAELKAMAEQAQQFVRVWGTVRAEGPDALSLELAGWESAAGLDPGYQSLAGSIQMADGQTLLRTDEGQTLLLPDAPPDLAHGDRVWVHGPVIEPADGPYPLFEWRRIEPYRSSATAVPAIEGESPTFGQAVITEVNLVYIYKAAHNTGLTDSDGLPLNLVLPAWRFTGTTNTGDRIEIIAQAVVAYDLILMEPTQLAEPPQASNVISVESLHVASGRIVFSGKSTLPDGTCLHTQLLAGGSIVTWWPKDACAIVQDGAWQMAVRLGEGGTPDELDATAEYTLRTWQRDNPAIEAEIFPFDLAGPPKEEQ